LGIAQVYARTKEYDRALQIYNEILEYYPENIKALNGKYSMLQQIKDIIN
jgi:tetratricopeptide (TPR) repeat protein